MFRTFEFYSIIDDHDEQNVDSLFGLGLTPPGHSSQQGFMNPVEWMQQSGYIKKRIASIYIPNYDGTETPADIKKEEE